MRNRIMFLTGSKDQSIPVSAVIASAIRVPAAVWINVLAEGGHGFLHQFPYKFTSLVLDFLNLADPLTEEAAAFAKYGEPANCTRSEGGEGSGAETSPPASERKVCTMS